MQQWTDEREFARFEGSTVDDGTPSWRGPKGDCPVPAPGLGATPTVLIVTTDPEGLSVARQMVADGNREYGRDPGLVHEVVVRSMAEAIVSYTHHPPAVTLVAGAIPDDEEEHAAATLHAFNGAAPVVIVDPRRTTVDLHAVAVIRGALHQPLTMAAEHQTDTPREVSDIGSALDRPLDRATFRACLDVRSRRPSPMALAVLTLNIDRFGQINTAIGEKEGDRVLDAVADRLSGMLPLPGASMMARIGGDTFSVATDAVSDPASAHHLAERLSEAVAETIDAFITDNHPTVSVGLAFGPARLGSTLLTQAEAALGSAKEAGGGRSVLFNQALGDRIVARAHLESSLRTALDQQQFRLYYQPIVDLGSGQLTGFEALVRWLHPEEGLLLPSSFIGATERNGLIRPLGAWVLRTAVRQLDVWNRRYPDLTLSMAINVSPYQLDDGKFASAVAEALETANVAPGQLCVEITESAPLEEIPESTAALRSIRALGVRLALDDFGTGHSSFDQLRHNTIDVLKISHTFVAEITTRPEDGLIANAIIHLGDHLGVDIVAEGVETVEQARQLLAMGCKSCQGFLWSRPVPADEVDAVIDAAGAGAFHVVPLPTPSSVALMTKDRDGNGPETTEVASGLCQGAFPVADQALVVLSHELRTPIHVIQGFAQLLARDIGADEDGLRRTAVETILRQSRDMTGLVNALADARALAVGTLLVERLPLDIVALAQIVAGDLHDEILPHSVQVGGEARAMVLGDAGRLRQILGNLLVNAAKFSPPTESIIVDIGTDGEHGVTTVRVIDAGPGIRQDRVGELFLKFSRLGSTLPGTGFGLFLSRGMAQAQGGELEYRPAPRGGAEFILTVPAVRPTV